MRPVSQQLLFIMKKVLIFFVTAPAWQIFCLFILPILLFITDVGATGPQNGSQFLLLMIVWTSLLWLYSIGVLLHEKFAQYLNIPLYRYKICVVYVALYSILLTSDIVAMEHLAPFSLVSFGCNIYILYFVSKLIVLIERKSEVKFQDYIGTLILAWFYLIGVWTIQPRVTRLFLSDDAQQ